MASVCETVRNRNSAGLKDGIGPHSSDVFLIKMQFHAQLNTIRSTLAIFHTKFMYYILGYNNYFRANKDAGPDHVTRLANSRRTRVKGSESGGGWGSNPD